jgi:Sec-independent protein translocase protein TatA
MFGLGVQELLLLSVIGLLFFGKGLPGMMRSLGGCIQQFRAGIRGDEDEYDSAPVASHRPGGTLEPPRPPQRIAAPPAKVEEGVH